MFHREKKKNKGMKSGKISKMQVNGNPIRCLNMRLFYDKEGVGKLEIYTKQPEEQMHYDKCAFEITTTDSHRLMLTAAFDNAKKEGKLYHYLFTVINYNEFYA